MVLLFAQIVSTKKPDGKTYKYLHIVESYREGRTVKKRRVASLGNISQYSEREIEQIIRTLESLLQHRTTGSLEDFETQQVLHFGVPYVVQFLWNQLGLTEAIRDALRDREVTFDVARYVQAMVIHRLVDPSSKLRLFHTLDDLYLPDWDGEPWQLQHFYRALDYLVNIKPQLERVLYGRLTDLLNFRLSLVLYDLTSTHLHGHACPLGEHGYSRTHRPDLEHVELGFLVTPESIPITHEVLAGNVSDKQTVPDILKRLKEDFAVEQCVFVGDRGMVTERNMALMAEAGFPYIVAFHKRGRIVSDALLEQFADVNAYHELKDNLRYLEVPATSVDDAEKAEGVRYILCYNPEKARQDAAFRESALEETEAGLKALAESLANPKRGRKPTDKGVMLKVADLLTRKGVEAFFQIDYKNGILTYRRDEDAITKETLRDGKFLIRTNTDLPAADVVQSYKTLMGIERAFHQIKNFLDVGPVYHWNERRVRGHIFVCVLAYLFEQEMQVLYRRQWARDKVAAESLAWVEDRSKALAELESRWYTGEAIVRELRRWKAVRATFLDKEFVSVTKAKDSVKAILTSLGIPTPNKTLSVTKAQQQHMTSAE
ncbi:IS1634 family transposase [Alicyclobacillus mali (ex Roth et al. 2021)]|uniref:IS1634 family transposase n=1 Tax=Alicyclobacillus mali (ex Roth et al. 2021) TaxID=1123961 RepID=UPI001E4A383F|nr:IS1634 family transposase [Alicyclobacillus mali (ex Roth et al. 2021)]